MRIISIANIKGGVGKSTIAFNLAVEFATAKKNVLLIDADSQLTAAKIHTDRSENTELPQFSCVAMAQPVIHKEVHKFRDFEVVIIDIGGRDSKVFRSALVACHEVIIPLRPSQVDVDSTIATLEFLDEARSLKEIQGYLLLNQAVAGTKAKEDGLQAIGGLREKFKVDIMDTIIHSRTAFARSLEEGKGVSEYEPLGKAAEEIKSLYSVLK